MKDSNDRVVYHVPEESPDFKLPQKGRGISTHMTLSSNTIIQHKEI